MVIEYERPEGIVLTEKRAEGITVGQRLAKWQKDNTRGLLKKRVPKLPTHTPPDLHFAEITYFQASSAEGSNYFVAIGRDEDRSTIIVNDQVVFNEPVQEITVVDDSLYAPEDKPRFLCEVKDESGTSLLYVNQDGTKPIMKNQQQIIIDQSVVYVEQGYADRAIGVSQDRTTFVYMNEKGEILKTFEIEMALPFPKSAKTYCANDLTTITSFQQDSETESPDQKRKTFFRDNQLIAEDVVQSKFGTGIAFSLDYKTQISVTKGTDTNSDTLVARDGKIIYRIHKSSAAFDWIETNNDLSLVAIGFKGPEKSSALFLTPATNGWTKDYDPKFQPPVSFLGDSMVIKYRRSGVTRNLTIPKSKGQPEETTDEDKSVA